MKDEDDEEDFLKPCRDDHPLYRNQNAFLSGVPQQSKRRFPSPVAQAPSPPVEESLLCQEHPKDQDEPTAE